MYNIVSVVFHDIFVSQLDDILQGLITLLLVDWGIENDLISTSSFVHQMNGAYRMVIE